MRLSVLAAALLAAAAGPALAQGIDSRHSPYPESAYSGYVGAASPSPAAHPAAAYRFSGQHAGGPAGALR